MGEKKVKKPLVRRQIMIGFIALGITLVKSATFSTEAGPTEGTCIIYWTRQIIFISLIFYFIDIFPLFPCSF
jgi:hypothetical protein